MVVAGVKQSLEGLTSSALLLQECLAQLALHFGGNLAAGLLLNSPMDSGPGLHESANCLLESLLVRLKLRQLIEELLHFISLGLVLVSFDLDDEVGELSLDGLLLKLELLNNFLVVLPDGCFHLEGLVPVPGSEMGTTLPSSQGLGLAAEEGQAGLALLNETLNIGLFNGIPKGLVFEEGWRVILLGRLVNDLIVVTHIRVRAMKTNVFLI